MKLNLKWITPEPDNSELSQQLWPYAEFPNGSPAINLLCDDEYNTSRSSNYSEIEILVAKHHSIDSVGGFKWVTLPEYAYSLQEAKRIASTFIKNNPEFQP